MEPTKTRTDERDKTDHSLRSERGKTDTSFAEQRRQTENETDAKVRTGRRDADDRRDQSREAADVDTKAGKSLSAQRDRDDAVVSSERSLVDKAIVTERRSNEKEVGKIFESERKETDKNLSDERSCADSDSLDSKAALTSRDELLAIVSHDLRNPIGAILSYSKLLREQSPQEAEDFRKWAEVIERNAETSLKLIDDILDMEQFAKGKFNLQLGLHDINDVIAETVETFRNVAAERKISLHQIDHKIKQNVKYDRDRIKQVISNLISNALKFTPEGGTVSVEGESTESKLKVAVTDSGVGVPADQKKRIFERYTQLGNKNRDGLGLGLYISTMLIEAHHGKLAVQSPSGGGTKFIFTIPVSTNYSSHET